MSHGWRTPRCDGCISGPIPSFTQLCHQTSVLRIEATSISLRLDGLGGRGRCVGVLIDSAVPSHMSGASANTTNDVSSKVTLFGAIIFAVTDATTVLTNLIFVVAKSTVQGGQLS